MTWLLGSVILQDTSVCHTTPSLSCSHHRLYPFIVQAAGDVRVNANSARWYLSPGHAIGLAANIGNSARVDQFTQMRSRAEQGTATGGILSYGVTNGNMPFQARGLNANQIYSETDGKVRDS
jgi:hypothetical protein